MNIEQILARLTEIREMMDDEEKRGDTSFKDLEKEVRDLNEKKSELEAGQRMKEGFGSDENLEGEGKGEKRDFDPSQFRKVGDDEDNPKDEERSSLDKYLETRDITEDGLKLDEGY